MGRGVAAALVAARGGQVSMVPLNQPPTPPVQRAANGFIPHPRVPGDAHDADGSVGRAGSILNRKSILTRRAGLPR